MEAVFEKNITGWILFNLGIKKSLSNTTPVFAIGSISAQKVSRSFRDYLKPIRQQLAVNPHPIIHPVLKPGV